MNRQEEWTAPPWGTSPLLEANKAVVESETFAAAARRILAVCKKQTGATAVYVALREGETENRVLLGDADGREYTADFRLPRPLRDLQTNAYRENRIVIDNDFASSTQVGFLPDGEAPLRNAMLVPIVIAGKASGIMGLANKPGGFDNEDARRAQALGEVTTIALQRRQTLETLRRHKKAQAVSHIGHWEQNAYGSTPVWSDEVYRIFGLTPQTGAPSFTARDTVVHPEDRRLLRNALFSGFERGDSFELDFRVCRPDGGQGWLHAIGTAETNAKGKTVKMFGTVQDLTDLRRTQSALAARARLLATITDNMSDMVSLTDLDGRFTYASPSHRQLGYAPDALIGRPVTELVHEEDFPQLIEELSAAQQTTEMRKTEFRYRRSDGSSCWLETFGRFLTDEEGESSGFIFCSRDITERREMEAQLAQADRLSSMGMLAAGIAHEINNPLAYILYNLESLTDDLPKLLQDVRSVQAKLDDARDPSNPVLHDVTENMNPAMLDDILARFKDALKGTQRIRDIARGLGTFSRVEREQLVPVDLKHVIEAAINMAFNEIKYRARLVKDYGKTPTVMASEGRLSQVFLNLIINATHAIDDGNAEENEIRIRTWSNGDMVFAEVRDTGSGISRENLGKLFEPFFTTKKIGLGSGLGLAISKNIVESYAGTIDVSSEVGKGTRFTISLPARVGEKETEAPPVDVRQASKIRGRILIIDDEDGIRSAMARMLRGHDTVQAANGGEAMEIIEKDQAFDLVVCDMMMPDISGMDLHQWLAENHPVLAEQLIFITGGAFTPRARAYLSTVDNIRLEKPFDLVNFKKLVGELVQSAKKASIR